MMEEYIIKIATDAAQAGGAGIFLVLIVRWFISRSLDNSKRLEELKEKSVNDTVHQLKTICADVKAEVYELRDRMISNEKIHIEWIGKLNVHSERLSNTAAAMEGFVESVNRRFARLEKQNKKVMGLVNGSSDH